MIAAVSMIIVIGLVVAVASAVRAYGISPARIAERMRRQDPLRLQPVPARLPTVEELAQVLDTHPWVSDRSAPIAADMSAHVEHDACPWCALCTADTAAIAALVLRTIESPPRREVVQMPIVGVDAAVGDYRRQRAEQVEATGYYGEKLS